MQLSTLFWHGIVGFVIIIVFVAVMHWLWTVRGPIMHWFGTWRITEVFTYRSGSGFHAPHRAYWRKSQEFDVVQESEDRVL